MNPDSGRISKIRNGEGAKQYSKTFDVLSDPRNLCHCRTGQPLLNSTKKLMESVCSKKHKKQLLQTCLGSLTN